MSRFPRPANLSCCVKTATISISSSAIKLRKLGIANSGVPANAIFNFLNMQRFYQKKIYKIPINKIKSILNFNFITMEANQKNLIDEDDFRKILEELSPGVKEVMGLTSELNKLLRLVFRKTIEKTGGF